MTCAIQFFFFFYQMSFSDVLSEKAKIQYKINKKQFGNLVKCIISQIVIMTDETGAYDKLHATKKL